VWMGWQNKKTKKKNLSKNMDKKNGGGEGT